MKKLSGVVRTSVALGQLIDFVLQATDIVVTAGRAARAFSRRTVDRGGSGVSESRYVSFARSVRMDQQPIHIRQQTKSMPINILKDGQIEQSSR